MRTIGALVLAVTLFAGCLAAACAMAPRQSPPSTTGPNPCAESQAHRTVACEGDG